MSVLFGCDKKKTTGSRTYFPPTNSSQTIFETAQMMGDSVNITPYLEVYIGKTGDPDFTEKTEQQGKLWQQYTNAVSSGLYVPKGVCWLRFALHNATKDVYERLLCFNSINRIDQLELGYDSGRIETGGTRVPLKDWSYAFNNYCVTFRLDSHQTKTFYIKCINDASPNKHPFQFILRTEQNEKSLQAFEMRSRIEDTVFLFFYLGFLFFTFIYFLSQFLFNLKEKLLLVYVLYILFTLLYSFRDIDKHYFLQTAFPVFNGINVWCDAIFSYLSYIFYLLFVSHLLNLKKDRKPAYWLTTACIVIITLLLFIDIIFRVSGNHVMALATFRTARMALFPLILIYFALIIPFRGSYYVYFSLGSIFLVFGIGINLLVFLLRGNPSFAFHAAISSKYGFWGNPVNYTRLAVLVEVLFFSLGLSKKLQMKYTQSVILNLNNNYTSIIFHEIKNGLNKLIGLFKSKSSNSINYIQELSVVLNDSLEINHTQISLKEELHIAERYFNFRLKSNQKINFQIVNESDANLYNVMVPPMLLQPFIENCFKHAFIDGENADNKITVNIIENKKFVTVEIKDNGIGFKDINGNRKSKGTKLVQERLGFFNDLFGTDIYFESQNQKDAPGAIVTIYNLKKNDV
jgi:7TM diverse intracellular signalling/7TMR-DISM extracellular 2